MCVSGEPKVMAHLMFGILALTADQILRWAGLREPEPTAAAGLKPKPDQEKRVRRGR